VLVVYAVPHILIGMRPSTGIAWLVTVAVEMLAGGTGIEPCPAHRPRAHQVEASGRPG
jgi:hypothetical protein